MAACRIRPEIDGLRAIAVLPVMLYHAGLGCPGGFVGVDVFFVISGYLITTLILKDLDGGCFQLLGFWERRVRRILPALAVVVLAALAAGWFLFLAVDYRELAQTVVGQALLLSNVVLWQQSGYFAQPAELKPLLHTWSLAVEEQFYLLFPFLVIVVARLARGFLVSTLGVLCTVSFCISIYGVYESPSATFFLLPSRAWELLLGALLAAPPAHQPLKNWIKEVLSWGGLVMILWAVFFYGRGTRFPGPAALLPCLGTALVIWSNSQMLTSLGGFLALRPLVFIGLISYSLYLWHWPMLVFARYRTIGPISVHYRILLLILSLILAAFSWKFVESPFRKRILLKSRARVFGFAASTAILLLVVGLAIQKTRGVPSRLPSAVQDYEGGINDVAFRREVGLKEAQEGDFVELGAGDKRQPIALLVWGDSHAMSVMPVLDALCKEHSVRGVGVTHSGTAPLVGYATRDASALNDGSIPYNNAIVDFIHRQNVRNVLIVAYWHGYLLYNRSSPDRLRHGLLDTISALKDCDARIWIMKPVPEYPWNVPRALAHAVLIGGDTEQIGLPVAEHKAMSRQQNLIFEGLAGPTVTILDPTEFFVNGNHTNLLRAAKNGKPLYSDSHHLTVYGSMMLKPLFEHILTAPDISRVRLGSRSLPESL